MGLPIWARWIRVRGATKDDRPASSTCPWTVGGATIRPGDMVVLDADGVAVVAAERAEEVLEASLARARRRRPSSARSCRPARSPTSSTGCEARRGTA